MACRCSHNSEPRLGSGGAGLSAPTGSAEPGPGPPSQALGLHYTTLRFCDSALLGSVSSCPQPARGRLGWGPGPLNPGHFSRRRPLPLPKRGGRSAGCSGDWVCSRGPGQGLPQGCEDSLPEVSATLSLQSRSSVQQGDLDGARRLGRLARLLSITFIIMGIVIIIVAVIVNFAGEAQPHASLLVRRTAKGVAWPPGAGAVGGREEPTGATAYPLSPRKATQSPAATS